MWAAKTGTIWQYYRLCGSFLITPLKGGHHSIHPKRSGGEGGCGFITPLIGIKRRKGLSSHHSSKRGSGWGWGVSSHHSSRTRLGLRICQVILEHLDGHFRDKLSGKRLRVHIQEASGMQGLRDGREALLLQDGDHLPTPEGWPICINCIHIYTIYSMYNVYGTSLFTQGEKEGGCRSITPSSEDRRRVGVSFRHSGKRVQ